MKQKDETLYVGRLYLFGIPLWKMKKTKREWLEAAALMYTKRKRIECVFIDDEEDEHDGEF
ncbi:TPA: hypothetical protein VMI05_000854 [Streptococcus pyogenes]|uniref:hypothetical protein n=1 Tax=Streptococcus agalactiae TaxID=1311 RepID=UPI001F4EED23|nr:hypothetical protein [Streptococcus agalactiae]MCH9603750.1 hypothetical protein [Streptococcus agalactiae]HER7645877.1 hypothetical protein [Streptococcus pyogenes]HER7860512.1 hypothetical protein [Streptococcus pyogenes]